MSEVSDLLVGQVALVTGGASGIGAAICRAFAHAGAKVGINYRSRNAEADALLASIRDHGGNGIALPADVAREEDVIAMFDRLVEAFGRIDIVVANAGRQRDAPIEQMTIDAWNEVIAANLTGQFLCVREAVRHFVAQDPTPASKARGKIICMSSVHERIPWAGHVNYAASKGGVMLMMQSVAQEVAERGIRVNAIAPGAVMTGINRDAWEADAARRDLLKLIPYGRVGEPDDIAKAALWLASDAADYVTGTTLFVDGGMSLYPGFRENG